MPPTKRGNGAGATSPRPKKAVRVEVDPQLTSAAPSKATSAQQTGKRPTATDAFLRIINAPAETLTGSASNENNGDSTKVSKSRQANTASNTSAQAMLRHLALLLHSVALVTMTAKAQQGVVRQLAAEGPTRETAVSGGGGTGTATVSGTVAASSRVYVGVRVNRRWLDAVTRYCNYRVTMDDLARVAAAYPEWVQVKWSEKGSSRVAQEVLSWGSVSAADTTAASGLRNGSGASLSERSGGTRDTTGGQAVRRSLADDALNARVELLINYVPSIEDAVAKAQESEKEPSTKCGGTQKLGVGWRERVSKITAYEAFVQQEKQSGRRSDNVAGEEPASENQEEHPTQKTPEKRGATTAAAAAATASTPAAFTVEEEAMLATLSSELRASLSREKLRAVLGQMRKEAAQEDRIEYARIEREQEEERILSTYAHIRSLFGQKKTQISAAALLDALERESRFEDQRSRITQISLVLEIDGSGLSATFFDESSADITPAPISDLTRLTVEQLHAVLIYLDRDKGSVAAVRDGLKARHPPTEHTK